MYFYFNASDNSATDWSTVHNYRFKGAGELIAIQLGLHVEYWDTMWDIFAMGWADRGGRWAVPFRFHNNELFVWSCKPSAKHHETRIDLRARLNLVSRLRLLVSGICFHLEEMYHPVSVAGNLARRPIVASRLDGHSSGLQARQTQFTTLDFLCILCVK